MSSISGGRIMGALEPCGITACGSIVASGFCITGRTMKMSCRFQGAWGYAPDLRFYRQACTRAYSYSLFLIGAILNDHPTGVPTTHRAKHGSRDLSQSGHLDPFFSPVTARNRFSASLGGRLSGSSISLVIPIKPPAFLTPTW